MPFITLFSAPKPFSDAHIAMIQRNAIKSWSLLPDVEIILLGGETGLAKSALELGVKHLSNVERSDSGAPLISSMFQRARENGRSELLCIINSDMVLMSDFVQAAEQVMKLKERFVLLSQRWDLDVTLPIEFTNGWQDSLRSTVHMRGILHRPAGSDFFLFPWKCYVELPAFAIGRAGWDNWMIYKARKEHWPVIDCTSAAMIVHQNHDYGHLPGAQSHHNHPETEVNIKLAGGPAATRYTILDSTHILKNGKLLRPRLSMPRLMRNIELSLRTLFFFLPEDSLENIARPKRWKKRIKKIVR
jgi:hypothetical protein